MKSAEKLAFYGFISYSLSEEQFIFEPSFILLSKGDSDAIMSRICDFWQKKIEKTTLWKITLAFLTIAAGYTLVYKPLKSIIQRYYSKFEGINKDNLDKFLKRAEFSARLRNKLIC